MKYKRKIPEDLKKELIQAIKDEKPKEIAKITCRILARDKEAIKRMVKELMKLRNKQGGD